MSAEGRWGSKDSTFVCELLRLAEMRIPAKEWQKQTYRAAWMIKLKAELVAPVLIGLSQPTTMRDTSLVSLHCKDRPCRNIQLKRGENFRRDNMLLNLDFLLGHLRSNVSSHLRDLTLEQWCHSHKTLTPKCFTWGRHSGSSALVPSDARPVRATKAPDTLQ